MSLLGFINYQPSAPSLFLGSVSLKRPVFVSKPAKKKKKKKQGAQTSQIGPPSLVFHRNKEKFMPLLRIFLLKISFEFINSPYYYLPNLDLSRRYSKSWLFQGNSITPRWYNLWSFCFCFCFGLFAFGFCLYGSEWSSYPFSKIFRISKWITEQHFVVQY